MDAMKISSPLRILLVEDNEHDRLSFRRAFHKSQIACEIDDYMIKDPGQGYLEQK